MILPPSPFLKTYVRCMRRAQHIDSRYVRRSEELRNYVICSLKLLLAEGCRITGFEPGHIIHSTTRSAICRWQQLGSIRAQPGYPRKPHQQVKGFLVSPLLPDLCEDDVKSARLASFCVLLSCNIVYGGKQRVLPPVKRFL